MNLWRTSFRRSQGSFVHSRKALRFDQAWMVCGVAALLLTQVLAPMAQMSALKFRLVGGSFMPWSVIGTQLSAVFQVTGFMSAVIGRQLDESDCIFLFLFFFFLLWLCKEQEIGVILSFWRRDITTAVLWHCQVGDKCAYTCSALSQCLMEPWTWFTVWQRLNQQNLAPAVTSCSLVLFHTFWQWNKVSTERHFHRCQLLCCGVFV